MAKKRFKLTKQERDIERSIAGRDWRKIAPEELPEIVEAAVRKIKESPVTIQMSPDDLKMLRMMANREGVDYRVLIAIILHKFISGQIVDKANLKKTIRALVREE